MALIELGPMVSGIKGSIGGTTFQNTAAGIIARSKPRGRKSATPEQSLARQFPNTFIGWWQGLTISDQLTWAGFASAHTHTNNFGQVKTLTGFQWFELINYNLIRAGQPTVDTAPTFFPAEAVDDFTVGITAASLDIHFSGATTPVDSIALVWATTIIGSTNTSNRSRYRLIDSFNYGGGIVDFDVYTEWKIKFGYDFATFPGSTLVKIILGVQNLNVKSGICSPILFRAGEAIL